jgi:hypothetical protein
VRRGAADQRQRAARSEWERHRRVAVPKKPQSGSSKQPQEIA